MLIKVNKVPIKIFDKPIMSLKKYFNVADRIGYGALNLDDMDFIQNYSEDIVILRNGCYGHRHWLAIKHNKKRKIIGLTVGHAGWMTERHIWKKEGIHTELFEDDRKLRFLLIGGLDNEIKYISLLNWLLSQNHYQLYHIIELIRTELWSDEQLIEQLLELFKSDVISFSHETYYICGNPSGWTDEEWWRAQREKGTFLYSVLKGLYRMGFKKKELESLRKIMRTIHKRTNEYIKPEWGFMRFKQHKVKK